MRLHRNNAPWVMGIGFLVGALSGFFGIGGGFLIVPGLVAATSMALITAIGSSLVSVTAFGLTTAVNYALSGLIDWRLVWRSVAGLLQSSSVSPMPLAISVLPFPLSPWHNAQSCA